MTTAALAANAYTAAARKFGGNAAGGLPQASPAKPDLSFSNVLAQAMDSVSSTGKAADTATANATTGRTDMIDVVTAVAESETAMQTLISVRDRVISAYEEIMRMAI
jgi:flagellar hook-basal body complex protein FliE